MPHLVQIHLGLVLGFLGLLGSPLQAAPKARKNPPKYVKLYQAKTFTGPTGGRIVYRLFSPKITDQEKRYPLVIFLHGKARKGSDNLKQILTPGASVWLKPKLQDKYPCFVFAPQCPADDGWSRPLPPHIKARQDAAKANGQKSQKEIPVELLELIIKQLIKGNPIDAKRLYVTGQSGGGGGTLTLITRRPKVYAAAVPVCPGSQFTPQTLAQKIAHMPLWFFHGRIDQVIPVQKSRDRVAALKKAGSTVRYTEYPRVKHNAWDKAYAEPAMVKWLFEQKLEPLDD